MERAVVGRRTNFVRRSSAVQLALVCRAKLVFMTAGAADRQHQNPESSAKINRPQNNQNHNTILHVHARSFVIRHCKSNTHPNDDEDDDPDVEVEAEVVSKNLGRRAARGFSAPDDFAEFSVEINRECHVDDGDDDDEDVVRHRVGAGAGALHRGVLRHEDDAADDGGDVHEEGEDDEERVGRVLADALVDGAGAVVAAFLAGFTRVADAIATFVAAGSADFTTDEHLVFFVRFF